MRTKKQEKFINDLLSGKFLNMVQESLPGIKINNSNEIYNVMKPLVSSHCDVECFYGIFLNAQNEILSIEKMFNGSIISSAVYPREVAKKALELKASAVIFCHNHPSGNINPSTADKMITKKLILVLSNLDVCVHEHLIIGDGFYSFADNGLIQEMVKNINSFMNSLNC